MAVSPGYRAYVEEQIGRIVPVRSRRMFGGVGLYAGELFFALIDEDVLYLKADDVTRPAFEAAGARRFHPFADERSMSYYTLPGGVLDDADRLEPWIRKALAAAERKSVRRRKRAAPARGTDPADSRSGGGPRSPRPPPSSRRRDTDPES